MNAPTDQDITTSDHSDGEFAKEIDAYLSRLNKELEGLPSGKRNEIREDIEAHLDEAIGAMETPSAAGLRTIFDRVGDPAAIAAEARAQLNAPPRPPLTGVELGALACLVIGGFAFPIFLPALGLYMMYRSSIWTLRQKRIAAAATLSVIVAVFVVFVLAIAGVQMISATGIPQTVITSSGHQIVGTPPSTWRVASYVVGGVLFLGGPVVAGIYLLRVARIVGRLTAVLIAVVGIWLASGYGMASLPISGSSDAHADSGPGTSYGSPTPDLTCTNFYESGGNVGVKVDLSISICGDGKKAFVNWGPDCHGVGRVFDVEANNTCKVETTSDGSIVVTGHATTSALLPRQGFGSEATWIMITVRPDGSFTRTYFEGQ